MAIAITCATGASSGQNKASRPVARGSPGQLSRDCCRLVAAAADDLARKPKEGIVLPGHEADGKGLIRSHE